MEQQPLFLAGPSALLTNQLCALSRWRSVIIHSLSALLLLVCILLYPERPAWGNDMHIQIENNKIKGYAHQVSLGIILSELARQGGYTVYVDENLFDAPTSFSLPMYIPAERAIQRIVHPHSIALIFTRLAEQSTARVSQVKVFSKGNLSTSYAQLDGSGRIITHTTYAHGKSMRANGPLFSGMHAGPEAVQKHVKAPVIITENAMGFTGFKFKDKQRGPDYRPDTIALAKAYIQYRKDREAYTVNGQSSELADAKATAETAKSSYRAQRNESIQQTISNAQQLRRDTQCKDD